MAYFFETSTDINKPKEIVWQILMDTNNYKNWNNVITTLSGIKRVGSDGILILNLNEKSSITWPIEYKTITENEEFAWTAKLIGHSIFKAEHYFKLSSINAKSTRVIHGEKFSGGLGSLIYPMIKSPRVKLYSQFNQCLKIKCEHL